MKQELIYLNTLRRIVSILLDGVLLILFEQSDKKIDRKLLYMYISIWLNPHPIHNFFFVLELLDMAPFYQLVTEELKIPLDKSLLAKYQENNNEELKKLDERFKDAEQNL